MDIGQMIREGRAGWSAERVGRSDRAQVYAVATAAQLGCEDLPRIRLAAALEDDSEPLVQLARWFDEATYPVPGRMSVAEALAALDGRFEPKLVAAFRVVQPLIQPVGLE